MTSTINFRSGWEGEYLICLHVVQMYSSESISRNAVCACILKKCRNSESSVGCRVILHFLNFGASELCQLNFVFVKHQLHLFTGPVKVLDNLKRFKLTTFELSWTLSVWFYCRELLHLNSSDILQLQGWFPHTPHTSSLRLTASNLGLKWAEEKKSGYNFTSSSCFAFF